MYPQNDILARMRRRRVLEPPTGSTPPIALEQDAEMGRSDPWSERLPDGRTVNEAVMETLRRSSQPRYRGSDRPEEQDDRIMRLPASGEVVVGEGGRIEGFGTQRDYEPLAGVNREAILEALKRGGTVGGQQDIPTYGAPRNGSMEVRTGELEGIAPPPIERSTGSETRPWKAGYGVGETDPLKRESARIRAMIENPTSKILPGGQVETPHPMSRWKAALLGGLFGLAQGDRNTSLAERLAAGGTGAAIGGLKPRAIQEWRRRMEVEDAQGQLAKQQKLGLGQEQIESEKAETRQRQMAPEIALIETERKQRYDNERLRIQQEVAEGRKSAQEADRELRRLDIEERKRHNLETEGTARARIQAAPDKSAENEAKREAFLKEAEDTKNNAEIYEGNAETNEQMANAEPKIQDSMGEETESPRAKELRKAAAEFRSEAQKLRAKIPSLRSKAESIPAADKRRGAVPYRGRTMSAANLERYAKDKGISVEEARQRVEAQGIKVR